MFKLADTNDRHVVQIFNEDQTRIIATILAIPDYRVEPTGNTVIRFAETNDGSQASGQVPENGIPIKEWFYPGDNFGNEFKVVPQPPVAEAAPAPPPPPLAPVPAAQPAPGPAPAETASAAPEPAPQPEEAEPAPQPAPAPQAAPQELPQTASQMPLVGLIGLISLAAAGSLRLILKKSA